MALMNQLTKAAKCSVQATVLFFFFVLATLNTNMLNMMVIIR